MLNKYYLNKENTILATSEERLKALSNALKNATDTTGAAFRQLIAEKAEQGQVKNAALTARDQLVEPFSLMADIFLRLIKMIVAPLVFSTLVVGVAKVGDINAVGRIGGKTMLWFVSASLISLALGMMLVNFFERSLGTNVPLPEGGEDRGLKKAALS